MSSNVKEEKIKFIRECIEVYRSIPALWDVKCKNYSNRVVKSEQHDQLLRKYRERYPDADRQQVTKKFNSLRTNFRKELKRINDSQKSGAGTYDILEPTLWYFDMKFLDGLELPCTSQNTMQIGEEVQDEADDIENTDDTSSINRSTVSSFYNIYLYVYSLTKFMLP
jgi:hypothetical protein